MLSRILIIGLTITLIAAAPSVQPREPLQEAGAAHAAQDYHRAIALYETAETRSTDPGFVAYNKALALYQRAVANGEAETDLLSAAEHFRRCTKDPNQDRRARAWLGRGNALLRAAPHSSALLKKAVRAYRKCIQIDTDHRPAAKHNLELALLLLLDAGEESSRDPDEPDPDDPGGEDPSSPKDEGKEPDPGANPDQQPGGRPKPGDKQNPVQQPNGNKPIPTEQGKPPGKGNMSPIPQEERLKPTTASDAANLLQQAAQRIQQERRAYRYQSARQAMNGVKDW